MMQPAAINGAVAKPNSSAPSIAPTTTSRPVRKPPSTCAGSRVAHLGYRLVDLAAGQLAALAGLGALCHLDLQHIGIDQVFGGDPEPAGSDLLDRRAHRIAVRQRLEPRGFLAAFAGVRLAADAVHRDR